jgi:GNAT superfamily N-acetyltransferase
MLDYSRPAAGEATDRAVVMVVFMRMNSRPPAPPVSLPAAVTLAPERLDVAAYRRLYNDVGTPWLWWLRRVMPDALLARHLANPAVAIHVLRINGEPAGFFETESTTWPDINLNYFGLRPNAIGLGLGKQMLNAAIASVFTGTPGLRGLTVNTCTADHPRALPNYLAAGFTEIRRVREIWDIPTRLGLTIPTHLRG